MQCLRELRQDDAISEEDYQNYRRLIEASYRGLEGLANELDLPVASLLGFKREFMSCYSHSRHDFPDDDDVKFEFWSISEDKVSWLTQDVCLRCGMKRRYRRSKFNLRPVNKHRRYIKPVGYEFKGLGDRQISRAEASVVLMHLRLQATVERLAADKERPSRTTEERRLYAV